MRAALMRHGQGVDAIRLLHSLGEFALHVWSDSAGIQIWLVYKVRAVRFAVCPVWRLVKVDVFELLLRVLAPDVVPGLVVGECAHALKDRMVE